LKTFLLLFLVCYLMRGIPLVGGVARVLGIRSGALEIAGDVVKSFLAIYLAQSIIGTPIAKVIAAIGLLVGYLWFPGLRFRRLGLVAVTGTVVLLIARDVWLISFGIWACVFLLTKRWGRGILFAAVMLPITMFLTYKTDIYVIFGAFVGIILGYHFLFEVELLWRSLLYKIGLATSPDPSPRPPFRGRRLLIRIMYLFLALLLVTGMFLNRYVYRGFGLQVDIFRQGTPHLPVVAITFDDGPDPSYTPQILDILKQYNVKATFFMVGRQVERHPEIARRIVAEGHEIGNHTYSHYNLFRAPPERIREEILEGERAIRAITGVKTALFRPPRGLYDENVMQVLRQKGYNLVLWSVSSEDWAEISTRDIVANIMRRAGPGDILLFHDSGNLIRFERGNRLNTVQALPLIIEGLQRQGYTFVTVTQMMIISGLTGGEG